MREHNIKVKNVELDGSEPNRYDVEMTLHSIGHSDRIYARVSIRAQSFGIAEIAAVSAVKNILQLTKEQKAFYASKVSKIGGEYLIFLTLDNEKVGIPQYLANYHLHGFSVQIGTYEVKDSDEAIRKAINKIVDDI